MKYMLMFWVDESAAGTEDEDAAMMIAVKSKVEVRPFWDAPWYH